MATKVKKDKLARVGSNQPTAAHIIDQLDGLKTQAEQWERDGLAAANAGLYTLLEECLTVFTQLRNNSHLARQFNNHLNTYNIPCRADTSLAVKVVRYVFGGKAKQRTYAYARVLKIAADSKPEKKTMQAFIDEKGGIEEIRRTPKNGGLTPKQLRKENIERGMNYVEAATPIAALSKLTEEISSADGSTHACIAGLFMQDKAGTYQLVYQTTRSALMNELFAQAGAHARQIEAVQQAVEPDKARQKKRANAIAKATGKPVGTGMEQLAFAQKSQPVHPNPNGAPIIEFQ